MTPGHGLARQAYSRKKGSVLSNNILSTRYAALRAFDSAPDVPAPRQVSLCFQQCICATKAFKVAWLPIRASCRLSKKTPSTGAHQASPLTLVCTIRDNEALVTSFNWLPWKKRLHTVSSRQPHLSRATSCWRCARSIAPHGTRRGSATAPCILAKPINCAIVPMQYHKGVEPLCSARAPCMQYFTTLWLWQCGDMQPS